jgi:hypothetical protein
LPNDAVEASPWSTLAVPEEMSEEKAFEKYPAHADAPAGSELGVIVAMLGSLRVGADPRLSFGNVGSAGSLRLGRAGRAGSDSSAGPGEARFRLGTGRLGGFGRFGSDRFAGSESPPLAVLVEPDAGADGLVVPCASAVPEAASTARATSPPPTRRVRWRWRRAPEMAWKMVMFAS